MLPEYFLFLAKIVTFVIAALILLLGIITIASKGKTSSKNKLEIKKINEKFDEIASMLRDEVLDKHALKKFLKNEKKAKKAEEKALKEQEKLIEQEGEEAKPAKKIFVLHFHGDVKASAVKTLREEITAVLTIATPNDEVVVCLESPGGLVHSYGLAASQLKRIRKRNVPLTVVVDKVAASGGYMMACVANHIVAAPFAVLGSIGVVAQIPNFSRLLKKKDIDFEQITAGQYKRTLTVFGQNTKEGREKFQEEVNETHNLFKSFIIENRPTLNIDEVATGEHWFGTRALELNLIDEILTSDDYLLSASKEAEIFEIKYTAPKNIVDKFVHNAYKVYEQVFQRV